MKQLRPNPSPFGRRRHGKAATPSHVTPPLPKPPALFPSTNSAGTPNGPRAASQPASQQGAPRVPVPVIIIRPELHARHVGANSSRMVGPGPQWLEMQPAGRKSADHARRLLRPPASLGQGDARLAFILGRGRDRVDAGRPGRFHDGKVGGVLELERRADYLAEVLPRPLGGLRGADHVPRKRFPQCSEQLPSELLAGKVGGPPVCLILERAERTTQNPARGGA